MVEIKLCTLVNDTRDFPELLVDSFCFEAAQQILELWQVNKQRKLMKAEFKILGISPNHPILE